MGGDGVRKEAARAYAVAYAAHYSERDLAMALQLQESTTSHASSQWYKWRPRAALRFRPESY